ncbi:hypothetical protein B9479_008120 [Cryptococcus floricola]|uniref:Uncharacterized protein n=1 Tax=Cryptococcus floricola TaxID=2591691 RepID=A0A5D3AKI4_9TREE|nr:hypothetical protein B9479_008120 [Cryptococcus floricola]
MVKTRSERALVVRNNNTDLTTYDSTPQPYDQSRDDPTDIVTAPSAPSGDSYGYTGGEVAAYASSAQSRGPSHYSGGEVAAYAPSAQSRGPSRYTGGELSVYASSAQSRGPSKEAYQRRFDKVSRKSSAWPNEEKRSEWVASAVATALNRTPAYRRQVRDDLISSHITTSASLTGRSQQSLIQEVRDIVEKDMQSGKADDLILQMAVQKMTGLLLVVDI